MYTRFSQETYGDISRSILRKPFVQPIKTREKWKRARFWSILRFIALVCQKSLAVRSVKGQYGQ
jgi:hypothetical protein